MPPMTKLASILILTLLAACASSIDRSDQLRDAKLVAGISTKSDVVNMIGLPAKIDRDEAKKLEIWQYTGKPLSSSSFVPLPILNVGDIYGITKIAGSSLDIVHYQTFGDTLAFPLESQESNQGSNGGQTTVSC